MLQKRSEILTQRNEIYASVFLSCEAGDSSDTIKGFAADWKLGSPQESASLSHCRRRSCTASCQSLRMCCIPRRCPTTACTCKALAWIRCTSGTG